MESNQMNGNVDADRFEKAKTRAQAKLKYYHLIAYSAIIILTVAIINLFTNPEHLWFLWVVFGFTLWLLWNGINLLRVLYFDNKDLLDRMVKKELDKQTKKSETTKPEKA